MKKHLILSASLLALLAAAPASAQVTAPTITGKSGCLTPPGSGTDYASGLGINFGNINQLVPGITGSYTTYDPSNGTAYTSYHCKSIAYATAAEVNTALATLAAQIPTSGGGGGGLTAVAHDATLTGSGTTADPLKIAPAVTDSITAAQTTATAAQTAAAAAQTTATGAQTAAAAAQTTANTAQAGVDQLDKTAVQYNKDASGNPLPTVNLAGNPSLPSGTTSVVMTGVAAGAVTAASLDAVNGGQLYALQQQIAGLGAGGGINLTTGQTGTGVAAGSTVTPLSAGSTAKFIAGDNIAITQNGADVTIATKPDVVFNSVKTNDLTVAAGGNVDMGGNTVKNVGAGALTAGSTDAVNGGQVNGLAGSTAAALGGGATFDPATGKITAPTYTVGGAAYHDVGSALTAQGKLAVQYTADANGNPTNAVKLTGDGTGAPVLVSNVKAGSAALDATNVSQLSGALAGLGGGAAVNPDGTIKAPTYVIGGASYNNVGAALAAQGALGVQYVADANGKPTNTVALTGDGTGAPVAITNVKAGTANTDAVNYAQIKNLVGYDANADGSRANSVTLAGGASGPVALHNVAAGTLASDAATVGQVQAIQSVSNAYTDARVNSLKNYTDNRFSAMSATIEQNRKEARAGSASAAALAGLRYDDRPGKASIAGAIGTFKGATALATGIGFTTENQRVRFNAGLSYVPTTRDVAATVGATWTLN